MSEVLVTQQDFFKDKEVITCKTVAREFFVPASEGVLILEGITFPFRGGRKGQGGCVYARLHANTWPSFVAVTKTKDKIYWSETT